MIPLEDLVFHLEGYYDANGFDKDGYNKHGFDKYGYDRDGYDFYERSRSGNTLEDQFLTALMRD